MAKILRSIFKMPELVAEVEGTPPLRVVREGAATGAIESPKNTS
jgi:hypothetical protein